VSETYFQKGFGLKAAVGPVLSQNYASAVVDRLRALGHAARAGDVTLKLAREFGFCYGVDRAVDYAYQARRRFPGRPRCGTRSSGMDLISTPASVSNWPSLSGKSLSRAPSMQFRIEDGLDSENDRYSTTFCSLAS